MSWTKEIIKRNIWAKRWKHIFIHTYTYILMHIPTHNKKPPLLSWIIINKARSRPGPLRAAAHNGLQITPVEMQSAASGASLSPPLSDTDVTPGFFLRKHSCPTFSRPPPSTDCGEARIGLAQFTRQTFGHPASMWNQHGHELTRQKKKVKTFLAYKLKVKLDWFS